MAVAMHAPQPDRSTPYVVIRGAKELSWTTRHYTRGLVILALLMACVYFNAAAMVGEQRAANLEERARTVEDELNRAQWSLAKQSSSFAMEQQATDRGMTPSPPDAMDDLRHSLTNRELARARELARPAAAPVALGRRMAKLVGGWFASREKHRDEATHDDLARLLPTAAPHE